MGIDQATHEGKSNPQSPLIAVGRSLALGEQLKHAWYELRAHADAVVADGQ